MKELNKWDGWKPLSRVYIQGHLPRLRLVELVTEYERLVIEFNQWFVLDFAKEYSAQLSELDALQREWNRGIGR